MTDVEVRRTQPAISVNDAETMHSATGNDADEVFFDPEDSVGLSAGDHYEH